jgi:hypothetical protein
MNRKWLWRTAIVVTALTGALLGSYVHAHAATASHPRDTVIYAGAGRPGYVDPRARPVELVFENGAIWLKSMRWKNWTATSAVTRHVTYKSCGSGCVTDKHAKVKFFGEKMHGRQPYFHLFDLWSHGAKYCFEFDTGSGSTKTKLPAWYQTYQSLHGGC